MYAGPHSRSEAGVVLLAVMLGLIIISVLALGLVMTTGAGVGAAHSDLQSSEARAWSDAVILQAAVLLLDTNNPTRPRIDGVPQMISVMGQNIPVTITSEYGKVDLNAAGTNTLSNLLEAAGDGPAIATEEAHKIVAWRTGGTGTTETHPFETITELIQVPGITDGLYAAIAPAITVYNGRGRIDASTAPLLALEAGAGMDLLTAQSFIRTRSNNENTNSFGEVVNGQLQPDVSITGWAFQIQADFVLGPRHEQISTVIRMTGDPTRPYLTLERDQIPE